MTNLKEQAITMLENVPDDKIYYVIDILKSLNRIFSDKNSSVVQNNPSEVFEAWERFKKYEGIVVCDIDEKEELANARDEKYADFI